MNENPPQAVGQYDRKTVWVATVIGGLIGAALCGMILFTVLPSQMIVTRESRLGFDETIAAMEESIPAHGWVLSTVMDMNKSMAKHGVEFGPRVKLVKLCKPEYAKSVLTSDRHVATMMPCTFAVWEDDDGRVQVSKMNLALMAKMFRGNIATVMGERVVEDEKAILAGIVKD